MAGMKKSNVKKRSARSIELEQQRIAEETAAKEAAERKARNKAKLVEESKTIMTAMYGLIFAVISWLMDFMGIFATIAIILSIFGLKYTNMETSKKYRLMAWGGLGLGILRDIFWIINVVRYFLR